MPFASIIHIIKQRIQGNLCCSIWDISLFFLVVERKKESKNLLQIHKSYIQPLITCLSCLFHCPLCCLFPILAPSPILFISCYFF